MISARLQSRWLRELQRKFQPSQNFFFAYSAPSAVKVFFFVFFKRVSATDCFTVRRSRVD